MEGRYVTRRDGSNSSMSPYGGMRAGGADIGTSKHEVI